jgi:rhodanese-related sulfurtransferase
VNSPQRLFDLVQIVAELVKEHGVSKITDLLTAWIEEARWGDQDICCNHGTIETHDRYPPRPFTPYLVEDAALRQINPQSKWIVLDARPRRDYDIAHIPGAIWVDHAQWAKSFSEGKDREAWSRRIGALGIDEMSNFIIYDDASFKERAAVMYTIIRNYVASRTGLRG